MRQKLSREEGKWRTEIEDSLKILIYQEVQDTVKHFGKHNANKNMAK
jgi:hypothetical protein